MILGEVYTYKAKEKYKKWSYTSTIVGPFFKSHPVIWFSDQICAFGWLHKLKFKSLIVTIDTLCLWNISFYHAMTKVNTTRRSSNICIFGFLALYPGQTVAVVSLLYFSVIGPWKTHISQSCEKNLLYVNQSVIHC